MAQLHSRSSTEVNKGTVSHENQWAPYPREDDQFQVRSSGVLVGMQATAASVGEAPRHTQGLLLMVQSYLYHGLIEALWSLSLFLLVFIQGDWRPSGPVAGANACQRGGFAGRVRPRCSGWTSCASGVSGQRESSTPARASTREPRILRFLVVNTNRRRLTTTVSSRASCKRFYRGF